MEFERKKKIVLEELERGIKSYGEYLERKINERFSGLIGLAIRRVARRLFEWVMKGGVISRLRKNYEFVLDACEEVDGKSVEDVVKEKGKEYLSSNEVYLRANKGAAKIKELEKLLLQEFGIRLKIYSRIIKAEGNDYPELVRNAFREKNELKKLVRKEFELVDRALELMESERDLLRIPAGMRAPLLRIFSSSSHFLREKMLEDVDRIYQK